MSKQAKTKLITVREATKLTGYTRFHIYNLIREDKILSSKSKAGEIVFYLIDEDSLREYCRQQEHSVNGATV